MCPLSRNRMTETKFLGAYWGNETFLKFHLFKNFYLSRFRLQGTGEITCVIKNEGVDWDRDLPFCESK